MNIKKYLSDVKSIIDTFSKYYGAEVGGYRAENIMGAIDSIQVQVLNADEKEVTRVKDFLRSEIQKLDSNNPNDAKKINVCKLGIGYAEFFSHCDLDIPVPVGKLDQEDARQEARYMSSDWPSLVEQCEASEDEKRVIKDMLVLNEATLCYMKALDESGLDYICLDSYNYGNILPGRITESERLARAIGPISISDNEHRTYSENRIKNKNGEYYSNYANYDNYAYEQFIANIEKKNFVCQNLINIYKEIENKNLNGRFNKYTPAQTKVFIDRMIEMYSNRIAIGEKKIAEHKAQMNSNAR